MQLKPSSPAHDQLTITDERIVFTGFPAKCAYCGNPHNRSQMKIGYINGNQIFYICATCENTIPAEELNRVPLQASVRDTMGIKTQAKSILKQVFGYDAFWPLQEEIINHILDKKDCLVVMPTGGGKSLCYQIPALLFEGVTLVVSPLISLMKDQVDQLQQCGVPAFFLNSSLTDKEYRRNVLLLKENKVKLLYIAPETLLSPRTLAIISPLQVACLAIDEAHCISEWGHDFRPEYRELHEVRLRFSHAMCVALTATATLRVREDIRDSLRISSENEFIGSFDRPNLFLQVVAKTAPVKQCIDFLNEHRGESGIIYCFSRQQTDDLAEILLGKGFAVKPYHAGLAEEQRVKNQDLFIRDEIPIIVATIAFGMGINKPNVRFVMHYDLPKNVDTYYQEIGRAGRDGTPAHCLLLLDYKDIRKIKYFIRQKDEKEQKIDHILLDALIGFVETEQCRRLPLLRYFGESYGQEKCGMCDNCRMGEKDLIDITIPAQKFLSCVKRTGERFGAAHVIGVLRGSNSAKILQFGHDKLSTYGIGKEHSHKQWRYLSRQFIQKGLIVQEWDHGSLKLTEKSWKVLRGEEIVIGFLDKTEADVTRLETEQDHCDLALFKLLREKRRELAEQANLPSYVIFLDRTLSEMATYFPQSREALSSLHGVGEAKIKKYGDDFLAIITDYCRDHHIPECSKSSEKGQQKAKMQEPNHHDRRRHRIIGEAYNSGQSIEQLITKFNIGLSTLLNDLYQFIREGNSFNRDDFSQLSHLSTTQQKDVFDAFDRVGTKQLKLVYEFLNEEIRYEELHLLRLSYLCRCNIQKIARLTIVCLAISRKYGGHCIAGKDWVEGHGGRWIRPVSNSVTGELSHNEMRLAGGNGLQLLDIVSIPVVRPATHAYQAENYLVREGDGWIREGKLDAAALSDLFDHTVTLWLNGYNSANGLNDRIPHDLTNERVCSSLYLIKPDKFSIIVTIGFDGRKQIRARFEYRNVSYMLAVTDTAIEAVYLYEEEGEYQFKADNVYLTISLSEPFEGFCYKLVASVIQHEGGWYSNLTE